MPGTNPGTTGLISYWSLDEASGQRNDSHGTNHLTDNNTVLSAAGVVGNAADFEADNLEYLSRADGSFSNFPSSVASWVFFLKPETIVDNKAFISKWNHGVSDTFLFQINQIGVGAQFFIAASETDVGSNRGTLPVGTFSAGVWHHVIVTFDGSGATNADRLKVWINNVLQTLSFVGTIPTSLIDSSAPFELGATSSLSRYYDGPQDEVSLWSQGFTADERTWFWNNGAGRAYSELASGLAVPVMLASDQFAGGISL